MHTKDNKRMCYNNTFFFGFLKLKVYYESKRINYRRGRNLPNARTRAYVTRWTNELFWIMT